MAEPVGQTTDPAAGVPQLLVVDDDPGIRLTLGRALARFGYHVFLASNGADALAHLVHQPDVVAVLSDIDMTPMDGIELTRQVHHLRPHIPVLYLTGNPNTVNLRPHPAVDVLSKPVELAELGAAIHTVLQRSRRA